MLTLGVVWLGVDLRCCQLVWLGVDLSVVCCPELLCAGVLT